VGLSRTGQVVGGFGQIPYFFKQELDGIHHQIQTGKTVLPLLSQVKQVALNINLCQLSQISLSEILSKKMQRIEIRSLCIGAVLSNDQLSPYVFYPFHF
jgi:hypothetical protein